jgi:hypothetical protein
MGNLEGAQHTLVKQGVRRQAGDVLTIKKNRARGWRIKPGDNIKQCCFTSAVRTNEPGYRARLDGQRHPIDSLNATKMHVKIRNL